MAGVRIKDLQDAKSVIDKFNEMQFAVDSNSLDTAEIGHRHVQTCALHQRLLGVLGKKLDTTGGTVTGGFRVEGDTHVDEYLDVPELKNNRITATGNEFRMTDDNAMDNVATDSSGIYLITLKGKEVEAVIFDLQTRESNITIVF